MIPDRVRPEYNLSFFDKSIEGFADMDHELIQLSQNIDWQKIEQALEGHYCMYGRKAIATRLLVGLQMLRYMYNLSDEAVCKMWVENPYFQYFCGEKLFRHKLPMDRSSMTRWRKRIGDEKMIELLTESIETAKRVGALREKDMERIVVDTTVQEKAVDYPSEVKLAYDVVIDLGREAKKAGLQLKQNYRFIAKGLLLKASGYAHARQFNRLETTKKRMKGLIVKIKHRIENSLAQANMTVVPARFKEKLIRADKVLCQNKETKNKLLVWHAPEVEAICKGKARTPVEFGCKVSLVTNVKPAKGGHFILSARSIPGKPYDGHTLSYAIRGTQAVTGVVVKRAYVDKGYKGHDYENKRQVFISGQKRGMHGQIKRELKRRSAIEPIIGHAKSSHRLGRHKLGGELGDKINAIFAAIGFNLRQVLNFLRKSCHAYSLLVKQLLILLFINLLIPQN